MKLARKCAAMSKAVSLVHTRGAAFLRWAAPLTTWEGFRHDFES